MKNNLQIWPSIKKVWAPLVSTLINDQDVISQYFHNNFKTEKIEYQGLELAET